MTIRTRLTLWYAGVLLVSVLADRRPSPTRRFA